MSPLFIGREQEIARLIQSNWRDRAILAALYGRRRVGKTALVEHAFRNEVVWKFEGIEAGNTKSQITLFLKQLSSYCPPQEPLHAKDWHGALLLLNEKIKQRKDRALVIFFDEFQWMCEMKPKLVSLFKYFWDNHFSKNSNCLFILCGSVSSFIVKKVLQSKALYGRIDLEMNLQPLSVRETQKLLEHTLCAKTPLDVYMVLGGIPFYYEQLNPAYSLLQNLNENAFSSQGFFFREFDRLFISHFGQNPLYEKILRTCAEGPQSFPSLAAACDTTVGGRLSHLVDDLQIAGFIDKVQPVGKIKKGRILQYRLLDEYLHFYFSFIYPHSPEILAGQVSVEKIMKTARYRQWQGYAFERLCRKQRHVIADHLKFAGVDYSAGSWFNKHSLAFGAQVDLLFVRADKVLTACEIKYGTSLKPAQIVRDFARKVEILEKSFPAYAVEKILITSEPVTHVVTIKNYFHRVLTAREIFLT